MAADHQNSDTSPVDYKVAARDYALLITMLKWGLAISLALGFLVMILLAN